MVSNITINTTWTDTSPESRPAHDSNDDSSNQYGTSPNWTRTLAAVMRDCKHDVVPLTSAKEIAWYITNYVTEKERIRGRKITVSVA
jgi:hypothetical protein